LHGAIGFREFAGKGIAAGKYLRPITFGGGRKHKRHEVAFMRKGILAPGKYFAPAPGVRLNAFGNITGPTYVKMLSQLSAFSEVGYVANRTANSRGVRNSRDKYFVAKRGGKLRYGIYARRGKRKNIKPVLIEISAPRYSRQFNFFGASARASAAHFRRELPRAMRFAVRTAR
jgi:hypothetical protein